MEKNNLFIVLIVVIFFVVLFFIQSERISSLNAKYEVHTEKISSLEDIVFSNGLYIKLKKEIYKKEGGE
jgi:hypothetical protein